MKPATTSEFVEEKPSRPSGLNRFARTIEFDTPLDLECGRRLPTHEIALETYGYLNQDASNAILLCHGLTANQQAAGISEVDGKPGWWDAAVGPGRMIDTDRFFVVSPNVLGGSGGSSGPSSQNPEGGRRYGMRFPFITIGDMVASQATVADHLGIERFHAAIGGCMGGFQVLEWMARYPRRVGRAVVISTTPRVSTHTIALWSVLRRAIMSDPHWKGGDYYESGPPETGMALLAMFGALFWMSRDSLDQKYGLKTIAEAGLEFNFESEFQVEAMLDQVAQNAAGKFDANSLIYLTRAMDYFDLGRSYGTLVKAFSSVTNPTLLISYEGDWRYPPAEMEEIAEALRTVEAPVRHQTMASDFGHGGFLLDTATLAQDVAPFLCGEPAITDAVVG